jgi:hypothetical protein
MLLPTWADLRRLHQLSGRYQLLAVVTNPSKRTFGIMGGYGGR